LDPLQDFASGKSQVFTELEVWNALDAATPGSLVHPRIENPQELSDLPDGRQIVLMCRDLTPYL
jgi:hypothetical protein